MAKTYHIFISHSWAYSDAYEKLINLLDKDSSFSYADYSVPKDDPIHDAGTSKELYEAIKTQMSKASVVLILAGVYSTYSKWINKEIEIAQNEFSTAKPIIAIQPWGAEKTSSLGKDTADKIERLNSTAIIDVLKDFG